MSQADDKSRDSMRRAVRVGISGWKYEPWRNGFYPDALTQKDELAYASRALPTIEINSTFYGAKKPENFATWYAQTPEDFVFSVKAPQRVTHQSRLQDIEAPIARFLASGIFELKEKLGPVLWQFPPWFRFDAERFEAFLACLPHDAEAASAFVEKHLSARSTAGVMNGGQDDGEDDAKRVLRHAVEIRHDSFVDADFVKMLRRHGVALVVADSGGRWPEYGDVCTDFMYLRLPRRQRAVQQQLHGQGPRHLGGAHPELVRRRAACRHAGDDGHEPAPPRAP
ncbi:DUF72 domain-containing protein [Uliginosibacterium sp. H1]|uniref:DUF72 domain-containing protein n=1 Tax=Uliginosibacterium sp. H1 TaxID=3114757 RepID=UPI002E183E1C|nr:DUF72 domain-containing protein [Uliginosibacterium sp. H1]